MKKISAKKNKEIIIYNICNNQRPRIDFIVLNGNYYEKKLNFFYYNLSFVKFFCLK